jgi:hypothetical protein
VPPHCFDFDERDWNYALDLRAYGYANWYDTSYSTISGGEFAGAVALAIESR